MVNGVTCSFSIVIWRRRCDADRSFEKWFGFSPKTFRSHSYLLDLTSLYLVMVVAFLVKSQENKIQDQ